MTRGWRPPTPVNERIAAKSVVDSDTGCLLWQGYVDRDGYGRVITGSRIDGTRRSALVHRAMWEALVDPLPVDYEVDHECGQRNCVAVDHLRPLPESEHHAIRSDDQRRASAANLAHYRAGRL